MAGVFVFTEVNCTLTDGEREREGVRDKERGRERERGGGRESDGTCICRKGGTLIAVEMTKSWIGSGRK